MSDPIPDNPPPPEPAPPPARRFVLLPWWLAVLIVALALPGGWLLMDTQADTGSVIVTQVRIVNSVTLSNPSATAQEFVEKLKSLGSNPSLFLEVVVAGADQPMKTPPRVKTPIGNGLTFDLPEPTELRSVREIRVQDEGFFRDKMIDRVDVTSSVEKGQIFLFTLISPEGEQPMPQRRLIGLVLVISASALAMLVVVRFVAKQVV